MKKIIVLMLCVLLIVALPVVASAEDGSVDEIVTEVEKSPTDIIVDYVKENIDKVVVIVVMTGYSIIESRLRGKMNGSIGTLNNNAVAVAEKSADFINAAMDKIEALSKIVEGYHQAFTSLLEEIRVSEDEKTALKDALIKVETYLNTSKLANIEFADELANLLCLANIPNAKKEEFFSRHRAAVDAIAVADHTEVNTDDEEEK